MRRLRRIAFPGRGRVLPAGVAAAALWLAVLAPGAQGDQISCGQVLRTNTTITNSLVGCTGDGLVIGASGITVDLNGNTIQGTGLGVGIRNNGHDDVTIRNGAVLNFDHGVVLSPGTVRNSVTGLTLTKNEWTALELNAASDNHVAQNHISEFSDVGVRLTNGSSGNAVKGNTVGAGAGDSFVVELGSNRNSFEGNEVQISAGQALRVDGSSDTVVLGNEFAGSSDTGISMTAAPRSVVQANKIGGGGDAGILLSGGTASIVRFNAFGQSSDAAVILESMSNSLVRGNTLASAGDSGIVLRGSSDVRVIDNTASQSSDAGIFIGDGAANTVRGNILTNNAHGVELDGGRQNRVEFNVLNANLELGVEVSESANSIVFGNTMDGNGKGGLSVDAGAVGTTVEGNAARRNGGDGIDVMAGGTVLRNNLARHNQGWGIYAASGVINGGRNGASGNAEGLQCYLIVCSDGSDWQAPVRPPEPPDPLETGLPGGSAAQARSLAAGLATGARLGGRGRRNRVVGVVVCQRRRASRGRAARNRVRAVCKAQYKAKRGSRRMTGRLMRHGRATARGARRVRGGRRGLLSMVARRRPAGRYTLVLTFRGPRHRTAVVRRTVQVRYLRD